MTEPRLQSLLYAMKWAFISLSFLAVNTALLAIAIWYWPYGTVVTAFVWAVALAYVLRRDEP
jgi:O-antigen/teichoic acid export membrane protein